MCYVENYILLKYNLFSSKGWIIENMSEDVFSYSVDYLFILLMVSLDVPSFLVWSHLCIFSNVSLAWVDISAKFCYQKHLRFYCLCFLLGFLWFSNLRLIVYGISWWSSFFLSFFLFFCMYLSNFPNTFFVVNFFYLYLF